MIIVLTMQNTPSKMSVFALPEGGHSRPRGMYLQLTPPQIKPNKLFLALGVQIHPLHLRATPTVYQAVSTLVKFAGSSVANIILTGNA